MSKIKSKILTGKKYIESIKKGSILAYSLIVITVMLAIVGSLSVAAILQNKSAGSSEFSAQSLQTADSGAQAVVKQALTNSSVAISSFGVCNASTGEVTNTVAGGGTYSLTFFSNADGSGPISDCSTTLANVKSLKSVGTYQNTARAIQVAVAQTAGGPGSWTCKTYSGLNQANCPADQKLISGGCAYTQSNVSFTSKPVDGTNGTGGWGCLGTASSATAYAWCCK